MPAASQEPVPVVPYLPELSALAVTVAEALLVVAAAAAAGTAAAAAATMKAAVAALHTPTLILPMLYTNKVFEMITDWS